MGSRDPQYIFYLIFSLLLVNKEIQENKKNRKLYLKLQNVERSYYV